VAVGIETARAEWAAGARQVEETRADRQRYDALQAQVEAVLDVLRRRVGQTFTLRELVEAYADAERWTRETVSERAPSPGWPRDLATVQAAAFHQYERGALDYEP
jgi:hypothetical protein